MQDAQGSVLLFAGFRLDLARGCLHGPDGGALLLRPKSFDVLRHLLEHPGRLVSREELMEAVWPEVVVTDDSITHCITEVRRALGDEGQRILRTVPRRGYLLEVEVRHDGTATAEAAGISNHVILDPVPEDNAGRVGLALPDVPSLVVLPFANLSGDPEQEYFADGMTEELTTAVSRCRWFFVIARNSAFTYKGKAADMRQIGKELGVRYVLEGSVRKAGGRVRITVQLSETKMGHQVWAERFDGSLEDIFELQDRVAEAVAGAIEPNLRAAEMQRSARKPTESLDAYDLYLRALSHFYQFTRSGNDTALAFLRQAIALDPHFSLAKAAAAAHHVIRKSQGWSEPEEWSEGIQWAREVLTTAQDDPATLRLVALAIAYLARDYDAGLATAERALALTQNSAQVLLSCAWVYIYACQPATAIQLFERAMRLSPLDPEMAYILSGTALAHLIAGNFEAAIQWSERSIRHTPAWLSGHRTLIGALMLSGREGEARDAVTTVQSVAPQSRTLEAVIPPLRNQELRRRLIEALRAAGLPG
ncbi:winged helix-turn-helix domain-containing tetratricopeptide repeat protein [Roseomonas sp. GCM10028921]